MKVLIPAMEKRSSLAAARSLGRQGIEVIGCSHKKDSAGFFSKYCSKKYIYNSPFLDVEKYVHDMKGIIDKEKPDLFLPINEETLIPLLSEREFFESKIKLPLPALEILEKTFNKTESLELAKKLNIPAPKLIDANFKDITFPVVARPKYSREIKDNKIIAQKLSYIFSLNELLSFSGSDFFFQEYIPGQGYGFYALFDRGMPKAYFMLKRINEIPFTGGPSSLRESVYDENLKEYGLKILRALKWHGLAMVEFRRDLRDGKFKFIEINPRLWGSLSLAIHSGVDFPCLLLKMVQDQKIESDFDYRSGIKSRWIFGDFSYLGSVLFGKSIGKRPSRIKACLNFLKFFGKDLHYDYFQLEDLKPALVEIIFSFKKIIKKIL
jgi:predicted ATP-grasp superfamily ATP-dependent carboligase